MKIKSKKIAKIERMNFTILNASPPNSDYPLAVVSIMSWTSDRVPPVKSSRTFSIDHPTVHFLDQFKYTWGRYFTKDMAALQYPAILRVFQL